MMLAKFRNHYPQGSLISELVEIDRGLYIVKVSIQIQDRILATALAGADRVETAEDAARERAIAALVLDNHQPISPPINSVASPTVAPLSPQSIQPVFTGEHQSPQAPSPVGGVTVTSDSQDNTKSNHTVNHTKVVNFAEDQSEIPPQPSISQQTISPPLILESPAAQLPLDSGVNQTTQPEIQPVADHSNLFGDTSVPEASAITAVNEDSQNEGSKIFPELSAPNANSVSQTEIGEIDFNEIKQKTDIEIKRLGWTKDDGRNFLKSRYGKRSRLHLTDEQLLEFLHHLENLPNPN